MASSAKTKKEKIARQHPAGFSRRLVCSLAAGGVCLLICFLVWLAAVRGQGNKSLSEKISDDYTATTPVVTESVSQTFSWDDDLLAIAFVFQIPTEEQPQGELSLSLTDADTGELLAESTGDMANILSGQYTGLGLSHTVAGSTGRHYRVTLTPSYQGEGRLALGCSAGPALWEETCALDGSVHNATLAMLVTYRRIGGFLTWFFVAVSLVLSALVGLGVWLADAGTLNLPRAVFVLVLLFGLVYSAVLPPYSAPDEQYHISQAFTLACRWANNLSAEEWTMGTVPAQSSYRREHDTNPLLQQAETTVFTWQEAADNFFALSPDSFDSHLLHQEAQVDIHYSLYLCSGAAVFLGYLLHLGFVPTLFLGRFANLLLFALLAAFAVRRAPFGRRVFAAVALLPMTLHLASSFSRDGPLLGLCLAFTALMLGLAFGPKPTPRRLAADWALAVVLALLFMPAKVVYLPLAALVLLLPATAFGRFCAHSRPLKAAFLLGCVVISILMNTSLLGRAVGAVSSAATQTATQTAQMAATLSSTESRSTSPAATGELLQLSTHSSSQPATTAVEASGVSLSLTTNAPLPDAEQQARLDEATAEGFVRRLYYYAEGRLDEPDSEISFWVQAMQKKQVSPELLGQSFFFSPTLFAQLQEGSLREESLFTAVSYVFWQQDIREVGGLSEAIRLCAEFQDMERGYRYVCGSEYADAVLAAAGLPRGDDDPERFPLDRTELEQQVHDAQARDAAQSVVSEADSLCYTPSYILAHPLDTLTLAIRSLIENGDHYLRTLVGGSLSYYSLDLAWGWILLLYALLAFAALLRPEVPALPARVRWLLGGLALLSALLVTAGCITWTPTYYTTIYGLQGRYLLPVLVPALLALPKGRIRVGAHAASWLMAGFAVANAGVLLNAMLAVLAR